MNLNEDDLIELAAKMANGDFDHRVLRWAKKSFAVFVRNGATVPLGRCFGLPSAPQRWRLAKRNNWLIQAAEEVPNAHQLAYEYDTFLSRGPWLAWRDLSAVPDGTSRLRTALFHAAKANKGKSLSRKQIWRIVGHKYRQQCPRQDFII